jgi:hypothetical protein
MALHEMKLEGYTGGGMGEKDTNMLMAMLTEQPVPDRGVRDLFYEPIAQLPNATTYHNPLVDTYPPSLLPLPLSPISEI